jgi:hypothetical protein
MREDRGAQLYLVPIPDALLGMVNSDLLLLLLLLLLADAISPDAWHTTVVALVEFTGIFLPPSIPWTLNYNSAPPHLFSSPLLSSNEKEKEKEHKKILVFTKYRLFVPLLAGRG